MEDHHVDRPEVQARQRVQLTGTNRPTGFDPIRKQADPAGRTRTSTDLGPVRWKDASRGADGRACKALARTVRFSGLVATAASETPDPIPNSAVKRRGADGTASQDAGE